MAAEAAATPTQPMVDRTGNGFGTFKGVFMPGILAILGVIMFLRVPWVLRSVGLSGSRSLSLSRWDIAFYIAGFTETVVCYSISLSSNHIELQ